MMDFIKKNWQLILFMLLALVLFYFAHNCANRLNIADIKDDHERVMKNLEVKNKEIKDEMTKKDEEILLLEKSEKLEKEYRRKIENEIDEMKKNYKVIPVETQPFEKLIDCQEKFNFLQADYNDKIKLIGKLELDIISYKKSEINWNDQKSEYMAKELNWRELEKNLNQQIEEQKIYIGKLEKKQRQPFFAVIIGGFLTTNGKFAGGIGGGVNIGKILKWIF